MKDKIKNLSIAPSSEYVIWSEDLGNIARDTTLIVGAGCVGLYLVNGVLKSINTPGRWLIKSRAEEKEKSALQLICVNTDKTFEVCCGVGNIPFKDFELNYETVVGAHGECKIRISQPWPLYMTFAHAPITAEEVEGYIKLKLSEIMTSRLAEVLQHYDYNNVMTQQSAIADDLTKKFSQSLQDIGIEVVSFALAGIQFNEDYQEQRKNFFDGQNRRKSEKEERRQKEREQRAEIDSIVAIANATRNLNPTVSEQPAVPSMPINNAPSFAPQVNNAGNSSEINFCPRCGAKLLRSAIFCPGCGKKLQ